LETVRWLLLTAEVLRKDGVLEGVLLLLVVVVVVEVLLLLLLLLTVVVVVVAAAVVVVFVCEYCVHVVVVGGT